VKNWQSELQLEWQYQLNDFVTSIVCAPNSSGWAASSAAGEVIWNTGLTDPVILQPSDGQSIDSIAFSADSRWLAAGGQAGILLIWNCEDFHSPPQLVSKIEINKWIEHLAWQPIESALAISYGAQVQIWDIPNSTLAQQYQNSSSIFDLAWHPTGDCLAMSGSKGVQIWAYSDSKVPIQHIEVDTASIVITWSGNGCYLATGNLDRTLTIIACQQPDDRWTLTGCPSKIRQMTWLEGSTTPCLAVASGTAILLWSLTPAATAWNGQLLEGHQNTVETLVAHPEVSIVASGSIDGYLCLWSEQGEIQQIITDHLSKFTTLAWHPQSEYLVAGSQTGAISLWTIPA
jgi:WD40 repeat protein